ncbi:MAG: ComEC/Rec2 family competence protein [Flavobacteriales bacterium]
MFEQSKPEQRLIGNHWLLLLLPFLLGIYLADFRQITEPLKELMQIFSLLLLFFWLWRLLDRKTAKLQVLLLLLSFFALGFWHMRWRQNSWLKNRAIKFDTAVLGEFTIKAIEQKKNGQLLFGQFASEGRQIISMQVYSNRSKKLTNTETLLIRIKPEAISNEKQPGAFDLERFLQFKAVTHQAFLDSTQLLATRHHSRNINSYEQLLTKQREALRQLFYKYLNGEAADIAVALIIGDRTGVDAQSKAAFQGTGSMHIMAVSGMHIALLLSVLLKGFALVGAWIRRRTAILLLLLLIWYYALLTGLSAAVLRSVVMFSILLLGQLSGRQVSSLLLLCCAAFLMLLADPLLLFDLGFQLSMMAMWGIFLLYPKINSWFVFRWSYLQTLWEGTALGLAATLSTAPLTLYYFHTFPNYFAVANLFLMSLSSFILIVGMLFPVFAFLPALNQGVAFILEKSIDLLLRIMDFFAQLPGALVEGFSFNFFWVLAVWIALYIWSLDALENWRQRTYIFAIIFLAELSVQRINKYNESAVHWMAQKNMLVIKQKGQLTLFELGQAKNNSYLLQGFRSYYGVPTKKISATKQNYYWYSAVVSLKYSAQKNRSLTLNAKDQDQAIQIY